MKSKTLNNFVIGAILILLASVTRLIPHLWNFTAVGAVFLFSTFYFKNRNARFLIPFTIMLFSDLSLYLLKGIPFAGVGIYLCLILYIPISIVLIKKVRIMSIALAGISGATLFFITSNFLVWIQGGGYGLGFVETFTIAIPFYLNHMMGNLFWSAILFGVYEAAVKPTKSHTLITED
jgi:hypothetical protein